jgi:hypothetical protein
MTRHRPGVWLAVAATLASGLAAAIAVGAPAPPPPARTAAACALDDVMAQLRAALAAPVAPSPAYRRYLRELLREAAATLPEESLRTAFAFERDPAMLEELAAALAARTDRLGEPGPLRAVAARATDDPDAAIRAAATRALRNTSTLEHAPEAYARLVADPAPEVRAAAAENLVVDNREVFGGAHGPAADTAVLAAAAAADPATAAHILRNVSTQAIGGTAARALHDLLAAPSAELRAAAATALGGVSASEAAAARNALLARFAAEREEAVRLAIIESIVRLGFAAALPDLDGLRALAPTLSTDIDEWRRVLELGLQEWSLLLREKRRLEQARP